MPRPTRRRLPSFLGILLLVSVWVQADDARECECVWRGSFSDVAANTDLVVLGQVESIRGNAVDITIERPLLGTSYLETIRVWMQTRWYCRPEVDRFPVGSRWILALNRIESVPADGFNPSTPNESYGRPYDFILSSCGGYFLRASGNNAVGNLIPEMTRWDYEPDMTPVLIDLIDSYLAGDTPVEALIAASREDPAARQLMLDTRSFLRGQDGLLDDE